MRHLFFSTFIRKRYGVNTNASNPVTPWKPPENNVGGTGSQPAPETRFSPNPSPGKPLRILNTTNSPEKKNTAPKSM